MAASLTDRLATLFAVSTAVVLVLAATGRDLRLSGLSRDSVPSTGHFSRRLPSRSGEAGGGMANAIAGSVLDSGDRQPASACRSELAPESIWPNTAATGLATWCALPLTC